MRFTGIRCLELKLRLKAEVGSSQLELPKVHFSGLQLSARSLDQGEAKRLLLQ